MSADSVRNITNERKECEKDGILMVEPRHLCPENETENVIFQSSLWSGNWIWKLVNEGSKAGIIEPVFTTINACPYCSRWLNPHKSRTGLVDPLSSDSRIHTMYLQESGSRMTEGSTVENILNRSKLTAEELGKKMAKKLGVFRKAEEPDPQVDKFIDDLPELDEDDEVTFIDVEDEDDFEALMDLEDWEEDE